MCLRICDICTFPRFQQALNHLRLLRLSISNDDDALIGCVQKFVK